MFSEILTAFLFQLMDYSISDTAFAGAIISKLILLSIVHAINIYQYQHAHNNPSLFYWVILLGMTFSSITIIHILFKFSQETSSYTSITYFAITLLLFMNISFFIIYNKLESFADLYAENAIMAHQMRHYTELQENRKIEIKHFRREKHNLKDQLIAIRTYALHNHSLQIIDFVDKLISDPDFGLNTIVICENLTLDALLSSKITLAKQHEIKYTWNLMVPSDLPFDNIDLCIIIGNALENAFEACLQESVLKKFVRITIHYKTQCLYCHIENSCSRKAIPSSTGLFTSTKTDDLRHGYGLSSIQYAAEKYNGSIKICNQNNTFSLKVLLYSKD